MEGGGLKIVVSRVDQLEGAELRKLLCEDENGRRGREFSFSLHDAHHIIG